MEADVLDAFETGSVLLSTLGFPVFEPIVGVSLKDSTGPLYFCAGAEAKGTGRLVEDGFVVLKDSTARIESVASARTVPLKRQALIGSGVLVQEGQVFRFAEDYLFDSPSGAASVILGRTANGWVEWKTEDGRTLHDVERAAVDEAEAS